MPIVIRLDDGEVVEPVNDGTTTYFSIIEEVLSNVRSFTAASDNVTSLKEGMTISDTRGQVDDLSIIGSGVIEIGDELMWVKGVDAASGSFTLLPKGRGWSGTVPAQHGIGDTVVVSPAYPRARVKKAINDVVSQVYPTIYSTGTLNFTYGSPVQAAWPIPATADFILDVRYRDPIGNWQRVRAWEVERGNDTADFPSGVSLRITQPIPPGATVRVIYGKRPEPLVNEDDLFTTTGLEERMAEVVILGVMAMLVPMLDLHRLQVTHVSADELDQPRPLGSAKALGDSFRSLFNERLKLERGLLNARFPARIHITR